MPRAQLTDSYKGGEQVEQFDSLKLTTDEYARMLIASDEGWWEYVHSMRAPVIADDNMPVIVTKTRKDKSTYPDYDMGFVGQRICLGDPSVVEKQKMDADRCPACASAARGIAGMEPVRRFAVPVLRYTTKNKRTTDLQNPPSATILVWKLTQRMYNSLMDVKREIRELLDLPADQAIPLRAADIVVFCEDGDWQRILFKAPMRPAYRHPEVGQVIKVLWGDESNRPTDAQLKAACGRDGDREYMAVDVKQVEERWATAERYGKDGTRRPDPAGTGAVSSSQDLAVGIDDLLGDTPGADPLAGHPGGLDEFAPRTAPAPAVVTDPFSDASFGAPAAAPAAAAVADPFGDGPPAAAPAAAPVPAAVGAGAVQSFDDILA
jgi:hypothetical protein